MKYLTSLDPVESDQLKPLGKVSNVYLYENPDYLPRAFWTSQISPLPLGGEDKGEGVIKSLSILSSRPGHWELSTDLDEPGWVFLSEIHYPGWKARVDGQETQISRSSEIFKAIPVHSGSHTIELSYDPFYKRFLWLPPGVMFLGLIGLIFHGIWRRPKYK